MKEVELNSGLLSLYNIIYKTIDKVLISTFMEKGALRLTLSTFLLMRWPSHLWCVCVIAYPHCGTILYIYDVEFHTSINIVG